MDTVTPQQAAHDSIHGPVPVEGGVDRVAGYGVMRLPFAGGDHLALRCWPAARHTTQPTTR